MKVTGPSAPTSQQPRPGVRTPGGFAVAGQAAAGPMAASPAASSAGAVTGVSALMTLQGVEDAAERRRRAVRRGSGLLDRLDELKLALLDGGDGAGALNRLARANGEARPDELEPGLAAVLDAIELRAAVEIAKRDARA